MNGMRYLLTTGTLAAALVGGAAAAQAQGFGGPWYVKGFGGANWPSGESVTFRENGRNIGDGDIDYDTGYTLGAALGNNFRPNFAMELEYAYRNAGTDEFSGDVNSNAFMLNALYKFGGFGATGAWQPYVGGGLGVANLEIQDDDVGDFKRDTNLAYQLIGGVAYQVTPAWSLNGEVRWFGIDTGGDLEGPDGLSVDTSYQTFDLLVGATYSF